MKAADLPLYYNLSQILEDNLPKRSQKVALYSAERSITFQEASDEANRVGNALQKMDVRFGDCVGILAPDSAEWVTTFFGITKIGAVALGMNTLLKPEEYGYILRDSRVRVIVVHESMLPLIELTRNDHKTLKHVVVIGHPERAEDSSFAEWISGESTELEAEATHRDDFASLHYSSGTTGPPKGILHAHKDYPLIAQLSGSDLFGVTEADRTFAVAKLFFVYGIGANLIFPWYAGASAIFYGGSPRSAAGVLSTVDEFKPTIFVSVPTNYTSLLAFSGLTEKYDLSSIRMCVSAGEALPASIWTMWKKKTGLEILDTIGCTESYHTFLANRPGEIKPGSSGKPSPGYEAKIVNDDGIEVQQGEIGHLMIKGESIALFYLHQSEKSRHTFRGDWLFTGDRYLMDEDGFYWHQGRGDDMLKIGGLWVSPVEIENVIRDHPAVLECAVIGHRDLADLIKPKVFITLNEGLSKTDELMKELLQLCTKGLETHKRPRWFEFVDELPRTATGKIQRFRLYE